VRFVDDDGATRIVVVLTDETGGRSNHDVGAVAGKCTLLDGQAPGSAMQGELLRASCGSAPVAWFLFVHRHNDLIVLRGETATAADTPELDVGSRLSLPAGAKVVTER
jgi:hypothetical protein